MDIDKKQYLNYVGKLIREKRKEKHLTQTELARLVGYTCNDTISKIERGLIDMPANKITTFSKVLGVPPSDFFVTYIEQPSETNPLFEDYKAILDVLEDCDSESMHQIRIIVETFRR